MILGSTGLLGNPVGLLKDLGVGVMDFFYEPAQGLAQSPQEFGAGIAKGTSSLVRTFLYGLLNSTNRITRSISLGLATTAQRLDRYTGYPTVTNPLEGFVQGIMGLAVSPIKGIAIDGFFWVS